MEAVFGLLAMFLVVLVVLPIVALIRTFSLESDLRKKMALLEARLQGLERGSGEGRKEPSAAPHPKLDIVLAGVDETSPETMGEDSFESGTQGEGTDEARPAAMEEEEGVPEEPVRELKEKEIPRSMLPPSLPRESTIPVQEEPPAPGWEEKWRAFAATVDWEQFTGVKLFAWLGGLALFCGAAFFVKYSIDKNLIPPALRLAVGCVTAVGLLLSSLKVDRKRYETTGNILAAGGIGVLYTVVFAAAHLYHYIPNLVGVGLLALVSMSAFVLSVHLGAVSISTLGAAGAYAAPVLLSTGQANLPGLFAYLAVVDVGVFEAVRRLKAPSLFLFSTVATLLLLTLGAWGARPQAEALVVAGIGVLCLALFAFFMSGLSEDLAAERPIFHSGVALFGGMLLWSLALLEAEGPTPLVLVTAGLCAALVLGVRREAWGRAVLPYGMATFAVAFLWIIASFKGREGTLDLLWLFLYGLAGALGPILLVRKWGLQPLTLRWFALFPIGSLFLTFLVLCKEPATTIWLWPIILVFHAIGIGLGILIGRMAVVVALVILTLLNALAWILQAREFVFGPLFHLALLVGAVFLCGATFWFIRRLPALLGDLRREPGEAKAAGWSAAQAEWFASFPALGSFLLLGTVFLVQNPLHPAPGMAVGVALALVALFLGKRMGSQPLMMTTLAALFVAQSCWVFRVTRDVDPLQVQAAMWAIALWAVAWLAPFVAFRPAERMARVWCAWALFEVAQAVLCLRAFGALYPRDVMGWFPLGLFLLKLPMARYLLVSLEGKAERNLVVAFHGGVLLFYLSALPVLLLDHGWLGLTLVLESSALLWLNRRIAHPGLPWVASLLAPAGLCLLLPSLSSLRGMDAVPVLNGAVGSMSLVVLVLFIAVTWAPREGGRFPFKAFFLWLATGSGFFLCNLLVADLFSEGNARLQYFSQGRLLQYVVYSLLWAVFGATIWKAASLPRAMRWVGLLLLSAGWLRVLLFPSLYGESLPLMPPGWNLGLLAYGGILGVLAFLLHRTTEEEGMMVPRFLTLLLVVMGFAGLTTELGLFFQPDRAGDLLAAHGSKMALATCAAWFAYGLGLIAWPRALDARFRLAGILLVLLALWKAVTYPLVHAVDFGAMARVVNVPTALFVAILVALVVLTLRDPGDRWPWRQVSPRVFWGVTLGLFAFYFLNVLIVELFGAWQGPFSFETHGSFAHQLAYSLGALAYAIALLWVGIRWEERKVRWTALVLFVLTAVKIFLMDLWSLGQLYRVASFIGLAVVLILVSYLYQRFVSGGKKA